MTERDLRSVPPLPDDVMRVLSDDEFVESVEAWSVSGTPWSMRDMNDAEWAARKLVAARRRIDERSREAMAWIEQVKVWLDEVTAADREVESWAVAALEAFARRFREQTKQATLKLPSITVRTRDVPGGVIVEDVEAFVAWAQANRPAALRVEYKPIAKEVAKLDESLPGLGYREDRVSVTV